MNKRLANQVVYHHPKQGLEKHLLLLISSNDLDQGWFEARRQLEYKQHWRGGIVVAVSPHYTSQTYSSCGHFDKASRLWQERFCCMNCGYQSNADTNAAKNILAAGHAVLAGGAEALGAALKPEPLVA